MLRFNNVEVHRLPCESIIGHQWQWAIRLGSGECRFHKKPFKSYNNVFKMSTKSTISASSHAQTSIVLSPRSQGSSAPRHVYMARQTVFLANNITYKWVLFLSSMFQLSPGTKCHVIPDKTWLFNCSVECSPSSLPEPFPLSFTIPVPMIRKLCLKYSFYFSGLSIHFKELKYLCNTVWPDRAPRKKGTNTIPLLFDCL